MTGGISLSWGDISLCLWLISVGVLFYFFKFYVPHKIKTQVEHASKEKIERLKSSLEKELAEVRHSLEIEKEKRNRIFGKMHDKRYEFYPEVIDNLQILRIEFYNTMLMYHDLEYVFKVNELSEKYFHPLIISTYNKSLIFFSDSELKIFSSIKSVYEKQLIILTNKYDYNSFNEMKKDFDIVGENIFKLTEELAREMRKSLFPENE